jgi:hypothetical protein
MTEKENEESFAALEELEKQWEACTLLEDLMTNYHFNGRIPYDIFKDGIPTLILCRKLVAYDIEKVEKKMNHDPSIIRNPGPIEEDMRENDE